MLAPLGSHNPKILILGSLPSQQSMLALQYYAHPQNAFWWIMQKILQQSKWESYHHKSVCLSQNHIRVWDVLQDAERPGSLDSSIAIGSEKFNDLQNLAIQHPQLALVAFNGKKAAALFKRHMSSQQNVQNIKFVTLPSTSPAHAAISRQNKLEQWTNSLSPYLTHD